jgi:hypothetical protein
VPAPAPWLPNVTACLGQPEVRPNCVWQWGGFFGKNGNATMHAIKTLLQNSCTVHPLSSTHASQQQFVALVAGQLSVFYQTFVATMVSDNCCRVGGVLSAALCQAWPLVTRARETTAAMHNFGTMHGWGYIDGALVMFGDFNADGGNEKLVPVTMPSAIT